MSLADFAIRRRVTIAMATLAVALFGFVSLSRLEVNLLPDLSYPTLTIRTELPGAAPLEVENLVTRPIEEAVGILHGVRSVRSVSRAGQSDVVLEFGWGTQMDFAGIEVRERLDLLQLPAEAQRPLLLRFDPGAEPILRVALVDRTTAAGSNTERLMALRRFADTRLKTELESVEGSAAIKVSGGYEEEIQVLVDQARLAQLGLGVEQVAQRLAAENVNLSGGRLEQGTQRFLVRTVNEFGTLDDMSATVVAIHEGTPVRLRDVGLVQRSYRDRSAITRLDGRESIELAVYREGNANTVRLARDVRARLDRLAPLLPPDAAFEIVYDQSRFITSSIGEVRDAAIWGGLLTVIVLYLFLRDARTTFVAGIAIPVTVIGIFVLMYGFDLSLNVMSLGGIALSIGMLVDNSVVILEAIARRREQGLPPADAAREGTAEVARAVTASTLTTVAVFFPLVFVSGIAGQLFRDQALTVTFAQLLSLLASLTLVPMLAAWRAPESPPVRSASAGARRSLVTLHPASMLRAAGQLTAAACSAALAPATGATARLVATTSAAYERTLRPLLARRRAVFATALVFCAATALVATRLGSELVPDLAPGEYLVKLRLPAGTALERTDRALREAALQAARIAGVDATYAVAGSGHRLDASPVDAGENTGSLAVTLAPGATRETEERILRELRGALSTLPGASFEITRPSPLTTATPLEIVLASPDLRRLVTASERVQAALSASAGFVQLRSSVEAGHPEIRIAFDQDRAAQLGLTVRDIADRVVAGVRGRVATRYRWRERKIDVLVRSVDARDASIDEVRALVVNPGAARPVTLGDVAEMELATSPAEVRRMGQERVAVLSATPADGDLGAATRLAGRLLASTALPAGVTASITGQSKDMQQSFDSLLIALALAVFLVYLVMASQFESLLHPFVILLTIPLGLTGAVWALWLTGTTLNAVAFIGLILLAGIVVNNSIVLVDAINQAQARGLALEDAVVDGGRSRLRPILITSASTILGLLPMAIGFGDGADIRRPMAITVMGGMLVATAVTLLVIPALYAACERRAGLPVATAASGAAP
jgi:HAE1 family hydrophobic/amphiphilic exporter-1